MFHSLNLMLLLQDKVNRVIPFFDTAVFFIKKNSRLESPEVSVLLLHDYEKRVAISNKFGWVLQL
jgi:hypothetical protein